VAQNIAFALRIKGMPKAEIDARVHDVAGILQLDQLLHRLPKALSGGQRQRVAIGRAIVREPDVFLFDEPLSNLDASLRGQMRVEISRLHVRLGATSIYVTHDQVEAMTLADKIVVLNGGRIEQVGAPLELYRNPANLFVATFIGSPRMNILPVTLDEVHPDRVRLSTKSSGFDLARAGVNAATGSALKLGVRPEGMTLTDEAGADLKGYVNLIERLGGETFAYVALTGLDAEPVILKLDGETEVFEHQQLFLKIDPSRAHLFDAAGKALGAAGSGAAHV
jgi:multiple sugar transport system ATP-binding protein